MLSFQYCLSTLKHDGGSVSAAPVSRSLALCLMIDLHGYVTDKDYEAISNGSCSLGCKHCSIRTPWHASVSVHTATWCRCITRFMLLHTYKEPNCVHICRPQSFFKGWEILYGTLFHCKNEKMPDTAGNNRKIKLFKFFAVIQRALDIFATESNLFWTGIYDAG